MRTKHRSAVKVLPLEEWMKHSWTWEGMDLVKLPPCFHRNGYYYNRHLKICWFEVNREAYYADKEDFLYSLKLFNVKPLRHRELVALRELHTAKMLHKKMAEELLTFEHWIMVRDTYRMTRKTLMDLTKKA